MWSVSPGSDPGGLRVWFRQRPKAHGSWPLLPAAPPGARSGALEEPPDFPTSVSHDGEQMMGREVDIVGHGRKP